MGARYRGRFAPSPTGPLHLGSLYTAVGSFLDARAVNGEWHLRIEDLDPERSSPAMTEAIQRTLEAHALYWDGAATLQSANRDRCIDALTLLQRQGAVFRCRCSRRMLSEGRYDGRCRDLQISGEGTAFRVRVHDAPIDFVDRLQGPQRFQLESTVGDFVVRRADGVFAYQLAVVVDDAAEGINAIVRGNDLLDNTPRQIHLQSLLDVARPSYLHLPVLTDQMSFKLSKQTGARPLLDAHASANLERVLNWLGIPIPSQLNGAPPEVLLTHGIQHWSERVLPRSVSIAVDSSERAP